MAKVVIHIGPHKTGTTALQKFLYNARLQLRERGLIYETIDTEWNNHHVIADAFIKQRDTNHASDFVRTLVEKNKNSTVLFSSEMFCEADFPVDRFIALFDGMDISVVAYLRNPCDLIVSAYNEVVRDTKVRRKEPIDQMPWPYDPSLRDLFRRWLFPGLVICPYDASQWIGGSIVSDFLNTIGIDTSGLEFPKERENVSMSFPLVEIVRATNIAGLEEELRDELLKIIRKSFVNSTKYPLPQKLCEECFSLLRAEMDNYRPYIRAGMLEAFLFRSPLDGAVKV